MISYIPKFNPLVIISLCCKVLEIKAFIWFEFVNNNVVLRRRKYNTMTN